MSKSFFTGTEAELYTGSKSFSTKISEAASAYGLSDEQAAAYAALDATWRAAYLAAKNPETRTRGAVCGKNDAKKALKVMASDLGKIIAGQPNVTNEQKIVLGLSVRATPLSVPPPGTPTSFALIFNGDGTFTVKWKCAQPPQSRGTMYQVWRSIGVGGERIYLGSTGVKRFVDNSLRGGSANVTYHVQAVRTTKSGPWAQFNVSFFGVGNAARVNPTQSPKIAA